MRVEFSKRGPVKKAFHIDVFVLQADEACLEAPCTFYSTMWNGGRYDNVTHKFISCKTPPLHFEMASYLDRLFWVPAPIDTYLEALYGKNWTSPGGGVYKNCGFKKEQYRDETDTLLQMASIVPGASEPFKIQEEFRQTMVEDSKKHHSRDAPGGSQLIEKQEEIEEASTAEKLSPSKKD